MGRTKSSSPRKKSEEKYTFQSCFYNTCNEHNATILPVGKVLSAPYKPMPDLKTFPSHFTVTEQPYFYYYVQNENYEKDGTICQIIIKSQKLDTIIVNALHCTMYLFNTISDLRFIDCDLSYKEILIISNMLQTFECIKDLTLDVNPNNMQNFYCLFKNNNLRYISLQNCQINNRGMKLISNEIKEFCKSLILVDFTSNFIGDEGMQYFSNALRANRVLTTIFLNDNWITDKGIESLMKILVKFELRQDEIELKRKYNFDYELQKIKLTEQYLNMKNSEETIRTSSSKSLGKKASKNIEKSSRKSKSSKRNTHSDLEIYIDSNLVKIHHPYQTECVVEDDKLYCFGNFKITYLNLAYNKITEVGLNYIQDTLEYQNMAQNGTDYGLLQINLQGNEFQDSPVYETIKTLLNEKHINQNGKRRFSSKK